jgi:E3 ubiquitin-protein ligase synoviolin
LFFGALRPNEVEVRSLLHHFRLTHLCNLPPQRLYDRLWFFITESLLAFTIFRDEFDTPFGLMFGFLLFIKSFHWLASDRIEWVRFTSISPLACFCKPAT